MEPVISSGTTRSIRKPTRNVFMPVSSNVYKVSYVKSTT